jgi:hypothetical protein
VIRLISFITSKDSPSIISRLRCISSVRDLVATALRAVPISDTRTCGRCRLVTL